MTDSIIPKSLIEKLLPQKAPFVMVSDLFHLSEEFIETGLKIKPDNLFVTKNHFNESGLIENIAQTVALYTSYSDFLKGQKSSVGYIGAINNITVHQLPKVNTSITTRVRVLTEFMGVTLIEGKIFFDEQELISLKMKTILANQVAPQQ
jgi:predicted hotdog family 3-hydroxylacyl-ACP dehydratase